MWEQTFKYDKCPKGTPNGWEHHTICKVCLGENVGNTVVKLGCSDSSQALVSHFLQHHKEEWENMHKDKQRSIAFTSRDSTGKSTRPSPLRTPTAEQHSLVDETRKSVKRLFDSTEGSGGSGSGGSRPGFGGRMPKLPTLVSKQDFKVRAKEEVDTYRAVAGKQYMDGLLLVDSNPLVWWKKYAATFPYLDQVARRYLVMPATSAPVERISQWRVRS